MPRKRDYRTTIAEPRVDVGFFVPGLLVGVGLILGYHVAFGEWMDVPSALFSITVSLGLFWWQEQRKSVAKSLPKERVIVMRGARTKTDEDSREALLVDFVRKCVRDNTLRYWESKIGRETYVDFRDQLIRAGYARWKAADRKQGWELTCGPIEILENLDLGDE